MSAARVFWALATLALTASYVTNGGFFGRRFARLRSCSAADKLLFLAGAMLALSITIYLTEGLC